MSLKQYLAGIALAAVAVAPPALAGDQNIQLRAEVVGACTFSDDSLGSRLMPFPEIYANEHETKRQTVTLQVTCSPGVQASIGVEELGSAGSGAARYATAGPVRREMTTQLDGNARLPYSITWTIQRDSNNPTAYQVLLEGRIDPQDYRDAQIGPGYVDFVSILLFTE